MTEAEAAARSQLAEVVRDLEAVQSHLSDGDSAR
jgi:hypothetical protein